MEAQIFFMEQDRPVVDEIRKSLERHISSSLTIRDEQFDPTSRTGTPDILATQYIKLLQAAIDPRQGMRMSVGGMEGYRNRLYFQVYYGLVSGREYGYRQNRDFRDSHLHDFFPAVAVRDQMVLVPRNLGSQLRYPTEESGSPLLALDAGGVLEVDFTDPAALEPSFKKVYAQLRTMFLQELQAYASYQSQDQLAPAQVAQDLKMDLEFVKRALKGDSVAFENPPYRALQCQLDSQKLTFGKWTKLTLTLENKSQEDVSNLSIDVEGPVKTLPSRLQASVPAGATAALQFAMLPDNRGEFPIEVRLTLPEDKVLSPWLPIHHIWLEVE